MNTFSFVYKSFMYSRDESNGREFPGCTRGGGIQMQFASWTQFGAGKEIIFHKIGRRR